VTDEERPLHSFPTRRSSHLTALKCGVHEPYSVDVARELIRKQEQPTAVQNNCSGKHAAMLALAKHLGAPTEIYDEQTHPVQQMRSEEHTSELQSRVDLVCRL